MSKSERRRSKTKAINGTMRLFFIDHSTAKSMLCQTLTDNADDTTLDLLKVIENYFKVVKQDENRAPRCLLCDVVPGMDPDVIIIGLPLQGDRKHDERICPTFVLCLACGNERQKAYEKFKTISSKISIIHTESSTIQ